MAAVRSGRRTLYGTRTASISTALRLVEAPQTYLKPFDALLVARGAYKIALRCQKCLSYCFCPCIEVGSEFNRDAAISVI